MRLIDANALMKNIGKIPQLRGITYGRMKRAVEETPTIDAVPVVRCRECALNTPTICHRVNAVVKPWDYCSYGKRKEDVHAE